MKQLLLTNAALVLVAAAVAAPVAGARTIYDGYKSSYPQLHATLSGHVRATAASAGSGTFYDGYKSSYPQLHATLSGHVPAAATSPGSGTFYDGYKSSYPQLHATLSAHVTPVPGRGFDWRDASVGAGTASGVIVLLATGALLFVRRRTGLTI
jgi:hypothetical protein